jgi:hypothetical protein
LLRFIRLKELTNLPLKLSIEFKLMASKQEAGAKTDVTNLGKGTCLCGREKKSKTLLRTFEEDAPT